MNRRTTALFSLLVLFTLAGCGRPDRARLVIEPKFSSAGFDEDLTLTQARQQWGFFDRAGHCAIDLQGKNIDSAWPFQQGMAKFKQGKHYGFLDRKGRIAIAALYDDAWPFTEGLAAVRTGNRWGFVDASGKPVIPSIFADAHPFADGLARVNIGGKVSGYLSRKDEIVGYIMEGGQKAFIDHSGTVVLMPRYAWSLDFAGGLARVNDGGSLNQHGSIEGGKWGAIDKTGREVIPVLYDTVGRLEEGFAPIESAGRWGVVNASGQVIIPPRFADEFHFSEGLAAVHEVGHPFGYIDARGQFVIAPRLTVAGDFVEGLAPASQDSSSFGFIDRRGAWAIQPTFYQVEHFSQGFALIHLPTSTGVVARKFSGPIHFCKHGSPGGGFVEVTKKNFIDRKGERIARRDYDDATGFDGGMAAVQIAGKWGYIMVAPQ